MEWTSKKRNCSGQKQKLENEDKVPKQYATDGDADDDIATASADEDEDKQSETPLQNYHQKSSENQDEDVELSFFARASSSANNSHEPAMYRALQELKGLVLS